MKLAQIDKCRVALGREMMNLQGEKVVRLQRESVVTAHAAMDREKTLALTVRFEDATDTPWTFCCVDGSCPKMETVRCHDSNVPDQLLADFKLHQTERSKNNFELLVDSRAHRENNSHRSAYVPGAIN